MINVLLKICDFIESLAINNNNDMFYYKGHVL